MAGEILDNKGRGEAGWDWPAIHPEGRKFALIAAGLALFFLLVLDWEIFGWPLLMASAGLLACFRDPERVVPQSDAVIIAPADGTVLQIAEVEPPLELQIDDGSGVPGLPAGAVTRVSIMMRVSDVYINRTPVGGTVRRLVYIPGRFNSAEQGNASDENERQHILVERNDGLRVGFTQIAGQFARWIETFVKPGDILAKGQRVGMIRLGSRVDVYLPAGTDARVMVGQGVIAGETVIAEIGQRGLIEGISQ
jgi:phosphatidylserine decarboxylase